VHKEYKIRGIRHLVYNMLMFSWYIGDAQSKEIRDKGDFRKAIGILELYISGSIEPLIIRIIRRY
jgi:hypothetical protein